MAAKKKHACGRTSAWQNSLAQTYAEFASALAYVPTVEVKPQSRAKPSTVSSAVSAIKDVAEAVHGHAAKRAMEAHEAYQTDAQAGTARTVEFNPAVPAKAAGSRLNQIFKERGIKQRRSHVGWGSLRRLSAESSSTPSDRGFKQSEASPTRRAFHWASWSDDVST